ncbi:hypothetical protein [Ruegeria arenilitoris]|uniref:hypothetical protein n=1 Tax=Ruegeria arenilitoris TaxID=1173585 RepID=UPI001481A618|nr:hypothetical protein [Ruegeria arenilitoris]
MKSFQLTLAALVLGLAATSVVAEEIEDQQKFIDLVVGKKLVQGETWVKILKDGKVEGQGPKAGDISGTWEWKGRYYCRNINIEEVAMPRDCQVVTIDQDKVTFTHKEGIGVSVRWTIE